MRRSTLLAGLALIGFAAKGNAQSDSLRTIPRHRDPAAATAFAVLLPGMGQFYTNRPWKGAAILVLTYAGLGQAADDYNNRCSNYYATGMCDHGTLASSPWFWLGFGSYLTGIFTARADANAYNSRHRVQFAVAPNRNGTGMGLSIALH